MTPIAHAGIWARRFGLLVVALGLFATAKLRYNPNLTRTSHDALYYHQIARHVAQGHGLKTSVSLWYQGLKELPHPATIYPLSPIVHGMAGRFMGLERAGHWIPEILFLVALLLLYLLGNRIARQFGDRAHVIATLGPIELHVGHLLMGLFGTNRVFFSATSVPYTEALGFTCAFATLLALERSTRDARFRWLVLAGALAGAAYLTRFQMVPLPFAVAISLLLAGGLRPGAIRAGVALAACAVVVLPYVVFLVRSLDDFRLSYLLSVAGYRETPEIPALQWIVKRSNFGDVFRDIWHGIELSMTPTFRRSYVASFGLSIYLVPLGAVASLLLLWRDRILRVACDPRCMVPLAMIVAGLGMLLPIHARPKTFGTTWLFGWRHGLPVILLIVPAAVYFLRKGNLLKLLATVLLVASIVTGSSYLSRRIRRAPRARPTRVERKLFSWLKRQPKPLVVASSHARWLTVHSAIPSHWLQCADPLRTRALVKHVPIDYLIEFPGRSRCRAIVELQPELEQVTRFGGRKGITVWKVREPKGRS